MAAAGGPTTPERSTIVGLPDTPQTKRSRSPVDEATDSVAKRALMALLEGSEEKFSAAAAATDKKAVVPPLVFTDLPPEIQKHVAYALSPKSLGSLGATSKTLEEQTKLLRENIGWIPRELIRWTGGTEFFLSIPNITVSCSRDKIPCEAFLDATESAWILQNSAAATEGTPLFTKGHHFVRGEVLQDGERTVFFGIAVTEMATSVPIFPDFAEESLSLLEDDESEAESVVPTRERSLFLLECSKDFVGLNGSFDTFETHFTPGSSRDYDYPLSADKRLVPLLAALAQFLRDDKEITHKITAANQLGNIDTYTVSPGWK